MHRDSSRNSEEKSFAKPEKATPGMVQQRNGTKIKPKLSLHVIRGGELAFCFAFKLKVETVIFNTDKTKRARSRSTSMMAATTNLCATECRMFALSMFDYLEIILIIVNFMAPFRTKRSSNWCAYLTGGFLFEAPPHGCMMVETPAD